MKRYFLLVLSLLLFLFIRPTTSMGGEDSTRFSSQANLVLVPVAVHTKSGKHVDKLPQSAFTVYQDGKPQSISVFQEIHATDKPIPHLYETSEFGNEEAREIAPRRLVVVVIDAINTSVWAQKGAQLELLKFLEKETQSSEPVGLVVLTSSGVELIQEFTTDPRLFADAVKRLRVQPPMLQAEKDRFLEEMAMQEMPPRDREEMNENRLDSLEKAYSGIWGNMLRAAAKARALERHVRLQVTIAQMEGLASAMEGLPGRKAMIWLTAGMPLSPNVVAAPEGWDTTRPVSSTAAKSGVTGIGNDYWRYASTPNVSQVGVANTMNESVATLLNNSNVAVYPVDVSGSESQQYSAVDPNTMYGSSALLQNEEKYARHDQQGGMVLLAKRTGGKACLGHTEFSSCIFEAFNDAGDYYLLGYYLDAKESKEGLHQLRVQVEGENLDVRHRANFLITNGATSNEDLASALRSPLEYTGLLFRGEWLKTVEKGDKRLAKFALRIPPTSLVFDESGKVPVNFDIAAIALDKDGKIVAQKHQKIGGKLNLHIAEIKRDGILYTNFLEIPVGAYDVHFVVSDNASRRIGSAVTKISMH
jgi:VWFA-related protein